MSNVVGGHLLDMDIAGRTGRPEIIEEMDEQLTKVIEDVNRTVNFEALRLVKETGKRSLSQSGDISFSVEQQLLLVRLRAVKTGYHQNQYCMEVMLAQCGLLLALLMGIYYRMMF
jgi:hypothetical protein